MNVLQEQHFSSRKIKERLDQTLRKPKRRKKKQITWIFLTKYNLASILYNILNSFRYMISNKTIKTDSPKLEFYYKYVITYIKHHHSILYTEKNSKINLHVDTTKSM